MEQENVTASPSWKFWRDTLKSPKYVLAPMVDASELAWRMLSRQYGAQLCYTPMWHALTFVKDARYRKESLQSCPKDRPLIVQFCANDPDIFLQACKLAEPYCDAVDLNLGCPQTIAKRGHYGSFLQDEWDLVEKMVRTVAENIQIPITCKIRVFPEIEKTVAYAKLIERAGCQVLTVHGRSREQKGPLTGLASWEHIKAVKAALSIPVIANGNIQYLADVDRCLEATGVDGVMIAEGSLTNPALFTGVHYPVWEMAEQYLEYVEKYPCPLSYTRGHLFKLFHHCLAFEECLEMRAALAKANNVQEMAVMAESLKQFFLPFHSGNQPWPKDSALPFLPWICQPYVRAAPEEHLQKMEILRKINDERMKETALKRKENPPDVPELSKKKQKKLEKNPTKKFGVGRSNAPLCTRCPNPMGTKCDARLCKQCCRNDCFTQNLDCAGHRIFIKTNREKAQLKEEAKTLTNSTPTTTNPMQDLTNAHVDASITDPDT